MFIIYWKSNYTNATGHGKPITKTLAEAWLKVAGGHFTYWLANA